MEFIHSPYVPGETIAAIATAPGEGGIAVIRLSGDEALTVADRFFSGPVKSYKTHTAHLGYILDEKGQVVDEVILLVMLGKRSFTGENTVEISCHGGALITRRVLEVIFRAGARAARPGEFSLKAYMNGKMDLAQAEAIQELIAAKNEMAVDVAENQLMGRLSQKISSFQGKCTEIAAILEAWVDFPEEDLEFATMADICQRLRSVSGEMQKLLETFEDGRILHDGVNLCLVGAPNVGKSSLMNALLDKERAIVTHLPGTTRDLLEDHMCLNGLNLCLTDTAGIRETEEIIEKEGIRRSKEAMEKADLVLLVLDASRALTDFEYEWMQALDQNKSIVIWNKSDLVPKGCVDLPVEHLVVISVKEKMGLEDLHKKIDEVIWQSGPPSKEELVITNLRHKEALLEAYQAAELVITGLESGISAEFVAADMRQCLNDLGKIIGINVTEDLLNSIFSSFCIGK